MFNELHSQAENNTYNETISQMQYSTVSLQLRGGGGRQDSKGALY